MSSRYTHLAGSDGLRSVPSILLSTRVALHPSYGLLSTTFGCKLNSNPVFRPVYHMSAICVQFLISLFFHGRTLPPGSDHFSCHNEIRFLSSCRGFELVTGGQNGRGKRKERLPGKRRQVSRWIGRLHGRVLFQVCRRGMGDASFDRGIDRPIGSYIKSTEQIDLSSRGPEVEYSPSGLLISAGKPLHKDPGGFSVARLSPGGRCARLLATIPGRMFVQYNRRFFLRKK